MKNLRLIPLFVLLILSLTACQAASSMAGSEVSAQSLPEAAIDTPATGANLTTDPITIYYHASDSDGVTLVELMVNSRVVASTTITGGASSLSMTFQWAPVNSGAYTLGVRAQNGNGEWSDPANITVTFSPRQTATATTAAPIIAPTTTGSTSSTGNEISSFFLPDITPGTVRDDESCGNSQVNASVYVSDAQGINGVDLFVRLRDPFNNEYTDWVPMALRSGENGLYSTFIDLLHSGGWQTWFDDHVSAEPPGWYAEIIYQFVAQDQQGYLTHTPVYTGYTLVPCP